jgi:hypothetical protein
VAKRKTISIDPDIKRRLGFANDAPDAEVMKTWKEASTRVCKPCWELKYCPYGPLVEDFPLLPSLRAEAIDHQNYAKGILERGKFDDGEPLDVERRSMFQETVDEFRAEDHPETIPEEIADMSCRVFGHICPVVFTAEPFTETTEERRMSRNIPPHILMRVARRDNYTCQVCASILRDNEIEFDHIIPVAKGGSSEEHNLRVTCFTCNRKKSVAVKL